MKQVFIALAAAAGILGTGAAQAADAPLMTMTTGAESGPFVAPEAARICSTYVPTGTGLT